MNVELWRDIKQRLADNDIHLGRYCIETLVEHHTVEGAVNSYLERQVFKVDEYIQPAHLAIHRMSVLQYLESLDATYDRAIMHLTRMGAMHGHCTSIVITQEMKKVMGDLKSLLGYSVHKTPHTHHSDPRT